MDDKEFLKEEKYLKKVQKIIKNDVILAKNINLELKKEIQEARNYYLINGDTLNRGKNIDEKADFESKLLVTQNALIGLNKKKKRLKKQYKKPYFAKLSVSDFSSSLGDIDDKDEMEIYIGMAEVLDNNGYPKVVDWRADISSLYYDFDCGKASYKTLNETINCNLNHKRQFQIENGKLVLYIDSDFNVNDEILQMELSKNSSSKMKSIIATLQKEQNAIIRNNFARGLLVQGVAGSGKTSIALHKIAYILYSNKHKLTSNDILIMSPSDFFSNYISGVLPDLDEDNCKMTTFEHIFRSMSKEKFISRYDYLNVFLKDQNEKYDEIKVKSGFYFKDKLKEYISEKLPLLFRPHPLKVGKLFISQEEIYTLFFEKLQGASIWTRIDVISDMFADRMTKNKKVRDIIKDKFSVMLYGMIKFKSPLEIYNDFLKSINLKPVEKLSYLDLPAYLLIKQNLLKTEFYYQTKYLVVDEMQDLTPVHFEFFEKNMDCQKLYLGDINQCIEKVLDEDYLKRMQKDFNLDYVSLTKSYRSTKQIFEFSKKIKNLQNASSVSRNGEEVDVIKTQNEGQEIERLALKYSSVYDHIAVLCKREEEIENLKLAISNPEILAMIENGKIIFELGYNAKGVEFDMVIIPNCTNENYSTKIDENLLYVCVTRALHKLCILHNGDLSKLLRE